MTNTKELLLNIKERNKKRKNVAKDWPYRYRHNRNHNSFLNKLKFLMEKYPEVILFTDYGFKITSFNDFLNIPKYYIQFSSLYPLKKNLLKFGFSYCITGTKKEGDVSIDVKHSLFNRKCEDLDQLIYTMNTSRSTSKRDQERITNKTKLLVKREKPNRLGPQTRGFIFKLKEIIEKYPKIINLTDYGFLILDFKKFNGVSKKYFRSQHYQSFRKQLYNYGFDFTSIFEKKKSNKG